VHPTDGRWIVTAATPIGTTKGPGETHHEYLFITPDRDEMAKVGEFVYYETEVDGKMRRVLGRITRSWPHQSETERGTLHKVPTYVTLCREGKEQNAPA
jgi:hypothetical protein